MNYPIVINQNLLEDEDDLIAHLRAQISRYSKLYFLLHEYKWNIKKTRNHRCASVDFSFHVNKISHTEPGEREKQVLPISILAKNPDLCQIVETSFQKLLSRYKGTSWARGGNISVLHIVAVKQFWFDCFTYDVSFFKLLLDSVTSKVWVSIENFFRAIESAQRTSTHNIFSLKRYEKKSKKRFEIQKLLFFFSLVQIEVGELLTKDNLFRVLVLANKRDSTHVNLLVDHYVKVADDFRGSHKDFLDFKEFKMAVLKILDD